MIRGVHTMFYSSKADELRAFMRDKLGLPCTDVGGGWLIFDLPEAEMGCHEHKTEITDVASGTPHISFYCDDIHRTVSELKERGVEFTGGITDASWGLVTRFRAPGDFEIDLYEPKYQKHGRIGPAK
jgi:catechol 2,3-dioxygenase-like lactoylglutathione lyase family enzyme